MKRFCLSLIFLYFCFCLVPVKAGSVIVVNMSEKDDFVVIRVDKNGKELEDYSSEEDFKKHTIKPGKKFIFDNVCFEDGEKVWAKAESWIPFPNKIHYCDFGLREGNHIIFINGWEYRITGRYLICNKEKFNSNCEKGIFTSSIQALHDDIMPILKDFDPENCGEYSICREELEQLEGFKDIINPLGVHIKEYYRDVVNKISFLSGKYKQSFKKLKEEEERKKKENVSCSLNESLQEEVANFCCSEKHEFSLDIDKQNAKKETRISLTNGRKKEFNFRKDQEAKKREYSLSEQQVCKNEEVENALEKAMINEQNAKKKTRIFLTNGRKKEFNLRKNQEAKNQEAKKRRPSISLSCILQGEYDSRGLAEYKMRDLVLWLAEAKVILEGAKKNRAKNNWRRKVNIINCAIDIKKKALENYI